MTSLGKYIIITLIYDVTPRNGGGKERFLMKRIQTLETRDLAKSLKTGGCGECQTSCQSACKTSCLYFVSWMSRPGKVLRVASN